MMRACAAAVVVLGSAGVLAAAASPAGAQQPRAFEQVVADLKAPEAATRVEAARQLGAAGYLEAALPLAPLLGDRDEKVAAAAMYAELSIFLGERMEPGRRVAFVVETPRSTPAAAAFADSWGSLPVAPVPAEVIEGLASRLTGEDLVLRLERIYALGVLGQLEGEATPAHEKAADALAQRLGDAHPAARAAAARAAGRVFRRCAAPCQSPAVLRLGDALVRSLNDTETPVLMAAVEGLGEMRYERGLEALTNVYRHFERQAPGLAALDAIARVGSPRSAPLFTAAAGRREPAARRAAVEGLARAGDRDGLQAAAKQVQARGANDEILLGVAFALHRAGLADGLPTLIESAGGRHTALQVQDYLVELGREVAPDVAAALPKVDGEARARLIEVLSLVGGTEQVRAIEAARSDTGDRVAGAARRALRRLAAFPR